MGTVLFADNFDNPAAGRLPKTSSNPAVSLGYVEGEYEIHRVDPNYGFNRAVVIPGSFDNASIAVDVWLVGGTDGRFVNLLCRWQSDTNNYYRLSVQPASGQWLMARVDSGTTTALTSFAVSSAIRRGTAVNTLELTCKGATISAAINGAQVGAVTDRTYDEGRWAFSAGGTVGQPATVQARFDNLSVRQQ